MVLETRSVVDALRVEIEGRILRGTIPAGSTLSELSVAQMFEVARPTAKAAIEQLVHLGLLRRSHNKTASVPLFGAADVVDVYLSRAIIETAVVGLLAERGQVPSGAIEALNRFRTLIKSAGDREEIGELVKWDIDFHRALIAGTGSARLRRLHESVIGEAHLCMVQVQIHQLLHPRVIADEHARVLALIEARKPAQARRELNAHIARARDKLLGYIQRRSADEGPAHPVIAGAEGFTP